jgi:uncharacterized protein YjbJ (UPF0337 family)
MKSLNRDPRTERNTIMEWNQAEARWSELGGALQKKWAKFTDDDLTSAAGKRDALVGLLQERYGIRKDHAEMQLDKWVAAAKLPSVADDTGA